MERRANFAVSLTGLDLGKDCPSQMVERGLWEDDQGNGRGRT